jgi:hypothetical protein
VTHQPIKHWKVEVSAWPRLKRERQHEFLQLAGDMGGEWWGGGCIVVPGYVDACRLSFKARALGFFVRMEAPVETGGSLPV